MAMNNQPVEELKITIKTPGVKKATDNLNKLAEAGQKVKNALGGGTGGSSGSGGGSSGSSSSGGTAKAVKDGTVQFTKWQTLTAKIRANFAEMSKKGKSLTDVIGGSKIGQFFSSIKRIALYRLIRSILSTAVNWAKEGLNNVYDYSKKMGTSFAPTMDRLASTISELKNSLGAALAQILVTAEPLIQNLLGLVINLSNTVNKLFAANQGEQYYTKAIAHTKEWREENEKLKKSLLGIDELNIIGNQKTDMSQYFVQEEVDVKTDKAKQDLSGVAIAAGTVVAASAATKIAKLAGLDLPGMARVACAVAGVGIAAEAVNYGDKIQNAIGEIENSLNDAVDSAKGLDKAIGNAGRFFAEPIEAVASGSGSMLAGWKEMIGGIFEGFNWDKIGHGYGEFWSGMLDPIKAVPNMVSDVANAVIPGDFNVGRMEYSSEYRYNQGGNTEIHIDVDGETLAKVVTKGVGNRDRRLAMTQ